MPHPTELLWCTAQLLGHLWATLAPERRQLALVQLQRALPRLVSDFARRTIARMFHHLAALPLELAAASRSVQQPLGRDCIDLGAAGMLRTLRRHHLTNVLDQGRGALVLSAHLGNFELALHAEALHGLPLSVVTKRLGAPYADRAWRTLRRRSGLEIIDDDNSLKAIFGALRRNRAVVFAPDQHANRAHAVTVPFFGRAAWTHRGLALVSARTRVPVVPAFALRRAPGHHVLRYMTPLRFERGDRTIREALIHNTARYTQLIEAAVLAHPDQWTWLHRRWKGEEPDAPVRNTFLA